MSSADEMWGRHGDGEGEREGMTATAIDEDCVVKRQGAGVSWQRRACGRGALSSVAMYVGN